MKDLVFVFFRASLSENSWRHLVNASSKRPFESGVMCLSVKGTLRVPASTSRTGRSEHFSAGFEVDPPVSIVFLEAIKDCRGGGHIDVNSEWPPKGPEVRTSADSKGCLLARYEASRMSLSAYGLRRTARFTPLRGAALQTTFGGNTSRRRLHRRSFPPNVIRRASITLRM